MNIDDELKRLEKTPHDSEDTPGVIRPVAVDSCPCGRRKKKVFREAQVDVN